MDDSFEGTTTAPEHDGDAGRPAPAIPEPDAPKIYRVRYSGFHASWWPAVQTLTRSGALEFLTDGHPSIQTVCAGVRRGRVVLAVVINTERAKKYGDPPVATWPRVAVRGMEGTFPVLCVGFVPNFGCETRSCCRGVRAVGPETR